MLGPYPLDSIITGDARELAQAIPDESVDLIFTDPPYPKQYLPLYGWLAETAARVLKPGGLCLAMAGAIYLPEVMNRMTKHLDYHWTFCMWQPGNLATVWPRRIKGVAWKPVLSFSKGKYQGPYFPADVLQSGERDKRFHHWGQHEASVAWMLLRLGSELILDPFVGGGTVPAVCKILERRYLAFEINPETADKARARVANTLPLFDDLALTLAPVGLFDEVLV
jgi:hypothetical protein